MQDLGGSSKEDLLIKISKLEKENSLLKRNKKFGLVWEDRPEKVATDCEVKLPVVKEVAEKAINEAGDDGPTNIIIEGDNYHALSVLNYTHNHGFDAIYIDPPYNTGAKTWKYNNSYVDGQDAFRHSKWLSFMAKRLNLARDLLKDDGIIVVTIDDYEVAPLTLLMDEIFGEDNHLGTVVIKNNPSGRSTASGFSIAHEYGLFYSRTPDAKVGRLERTEGQIKRYKEQDSVGRFEWVNFRKHGGYRHESPKMYYPIYVDEKKNTIRIPDTKWDDTHKDWDIVEKPTLQEIVLYPIDESGTDRRWKWSIERARKELHEMKIAPDRTGKTAVYIKSRMKDEGMLPLTWWDKTEYSATSQGTNLLAKIMPDGSPRFDYPKSLYAVMDSIRVLTEKKDARILDFFAGSGTTGHAVIELNKRDGGHRQFILCTNNENGIAQEITYPRIKSVIEGYGDAEGIPANVRYFKTEFVEKDETPDVLRRKLSPACEDMIRIREGAFDRVVDEDLFKVFKNPRGLTAVVFDRFGLQEYINRLEEMETDAPIHLYVFSYSKNNRLDELHGKLKHKYESQPIPEGVLEIYKKIFKNSKGGRK